MQAFTLGSCRPARMLCPHGHAMMQDTAASDMASQGAELTPHLDAHMGGQQQLDANTKALCMLRLSFSLGTWGLVVDPIQMADLAQLGGARILPSMWDMAEALAPPSSRQPAGWAPFIVVRPTCSCVRSCMHACP